MKSLSVTIQLRATEQYFLVVLFIMLHKAVLTSESVDGGLKLDKPNQSYRISISVLYNVDRSSFVFFPKKLYG